MPSERIGKYIDKYEIVKEVGRGGMGAVYKALHPQFKRYVAIKEIKSDLANNLEFQRRFELEVEILAKLPSHPNIVTVRDAFVSGGQLFLVMDYIEGGTLKDEVTGEGVAPERGAELLTQILSGLEAIHRCDIVHRDLKPGNILIDGGGIPYISDFGIAQSAGVLAVKQTMGTAQYAAPELFDPGPGPGGREQQVDVYAMGIVAYEMLLGENRFHAEFSEVYNTPREKRPERWAVWHTDLASAARNLNDIDPTIPRPLANVVQRMMEKDSSARYRNAGEARRDLNVWLPAVEDSRNRRGGSPPEDATVPLDQLRGRSAGSARPNAQRQVARTPRVARTEGADRRRPLEEDGPVDVSTNSAPPRRGGRSLPRWVWWACGAGALVLVVAVMVVPMLFASSGFTLIVKGAPVGSNVYVDNKRVGIPVNDGTIRVFGLDATQGRRNVRVSFGGCQDYQDSVAGSDGEQKELSVSMACGGGEQSEIDYNGPMILIPAGEFEMGDDNHLPDEKFAHKVLLPDFYIDKLEVTNKQYQEFCRGTGYPPPTGTPTTAQLFNEHPDYPVIGVSWNDALEYAKWAGKRLPAEAEWEKAASWGPKAQKKRQWPWGDEPDPSRANLSGNPGPVGHHSNGASAYGVQDMSGNAAEWVDSFYQPYPNNQAMDPDYGTKHKVVRGGGFAASIDSARTTFRDHQPPDEKAYMIKTAGASGQHDTTIGFRCAVSANDPKLQEYLHRQGPSKK
jgi:serine/threonine protein kinase/formylglycine-generating enzyme required for sulfatase activity